MTTTRPLFYRTAAQAALLKIEIASPPLRGIAMTPFCHREETTQGRRRDLFFTKQLHRLAFGRRVVGCHLFSQPTLLLRIGGRER